jgi:hypothetical protein
MQEKTMWRNVHLSVIDMQIQEKKIWRKRASIVLLRDAGLWRERETHTRLADALLSLPISDSRRFTSFGTPSFDAEESNSPSSGSWSSAIPSPWPLLSPCATPTPPSWSISSSRLLLPRYNKMRISSVLVVCSSLRFRFSSRCCCTFLVVSMIKPAPQPPPPTGVSK